MVTLIELIELSQVHVYDADDGHRSNGVERFTKPFRRKALTESLASTYTYIR